MPLKWWASERKRERKRYSLLHSESSYKASEVREFILYEVFIQYPDICM